jgi:hypothetical protein
VASATTPFFPIAAVITDCTASWTSAITPASRTFFTMSPRASPTLFVPSMMACIGAEIAEVIVADHVWIDSFCFRSISSIVFSVSAVTLS